MVEQAAVADVGGETIEIVEAGENDADLVAIMVYELLRELNEGKTRQSDEEIHAVCRQLLEEDTRFAALLALDSNRRPVGAMTLTEAVALYAGGKFGIIMELYVTPGQRSTGVGERLVKQAIEMGKERGWSLLEVNAPGGERWDRTRAFYAREGFKVIGPFMKLEL